MGKSTLQLNTYLGPYYLVKLIAIGGMAEIYLATTKGLEGFEKQLALKIIHPDYADDARFVQMLVDEAKIAVKLNHPNIAQTFDLGRIGSCYFISMEFVNGVDFFQLLKKASEMRMDFPLQASMLVVHETLRGLDYAHKKCDENGLPLKIIHRDVSPQNILISRHGEVKLVDFGIAKAANLSTKTRAGVIKGKLVYMSPEQSWGDTVDQRTDIFSSGIVLYEAFTGGSLYREKNPVKLLEMVRKAEIAPPSARRPEVSRELDALVMRALAPRPADRYQTAGDFADEIAGYMQQHYPGHTTQHVGELLESVMAGTVPRRPEAVRPPPQPVTADGQPRTAMKRQDFAVHEHSMIFSAEEMMQSPPPLPSLGLQQGALPETGPSVVPPRARLVLLEEGGGTPYPVRDQFVIGRAGDLKLGDARVSRRHARILVRGDTYVVEDLQSANGTFVNEEKIDKLQDLRPGDIIRIGPFSIRFEQEAPVPVQLEPPRRAPPPIPAPAAEPEPQQRSPSHVYPAVAGKALRPPPVVPQTPRPEQRVTPAPAPAMPSTPPPPPITPRPEPQRPQAPERPATDRAAVASVEHVEGDLTVQPTDGAAVVLYVGQERLTLQVEDRLPLAHTILVDGKEVVGVVAALVRRADGYWIEPVPGKEAVSLNGQPVKAPSRLNRGDRLTVGPLELEFVE